MKIHITTLFILISFISFAHRGEFVSIENVQIQEVNNSVIFNFQLENIKAKPLQNIKIELVVNMQSIDVIEIPLITEGKKFSSYSFTVNNRNIDLRKDIIQIEITQLFNQYKDWGGWDKPTGLSSPKQVNEFGSESYADAPWRMKKTDANGNLLGIPITIYVHDADLIPSPSYPLQLDFIRFELKNASDISGGAWAKTLDFSGDPNFNSYFSNLSQTNASLETQEFNMSHCASSSLSNHSIDFTENTSIIWGNSTNWTDVTGQYWYFTFTIPPAEIVGFEDAIDIYVTFDYDNATITNDEVSVRIFRSDEDIPSQQNWYRGDTHLHSIYTQNSAETGLPLAATKNAASHIGLDWITTTDHTSDFDNYGSGSGTAQLTQNWAMLQSEVQALNTQDPSMIFIPGQEVATLNTADNMVHFLAYPDPQSPYSLPYLGDGDGDVTGTNVSISGALGVLSQNNGFAYASHPFSTGDELSSAVGGGIWNISSSVFPANGSAFPFTVSNTGASNLIICNDLQLPSDVLASNAPGVMIKEGLKGAQIWNMRKSLQTTGVLGGTDDEDDPWDAILDGGAFSQMDSLDPEFHLIRFKQGQEVVNSINRLGLQLKNSDNSYANWKMFYSAGSDAHGSFNYSNTDDFALMGEITNNAVGKLNVLAYCPNGMGANGENVLTAFSNGNTSISDGPIVTIGLSTDGNNNVDNILTGEDVVLDILEPNEHYLNIDYTSTQEFGDVNKLTLILGTETAEFRKNINFSSTGVNGNNTLNHQLSTLLDDIANMANPPLSEYMYIRAELETSVSYNNLDIYRTDHDVFHSYSNPIWFKYEDLTAGINVNTQGQVVVYPNPAKEEIQINISGYKGKLVVELYDLSGRLLSTSQSSTISLAKYAKGVYVVKVKYANTIEKIKVVKG